MIDLGPKCLDVLETAVHGGKAHIPDFVQVAQLFHDHVPNAARRDLALPRALRALDVFDLLILDDIGYVQQTPEEAEVLFTLMAERYERRSMLITSNLVFSQWDRIFKSPMTTAAAVDRLVHHASILELDLPSFRTLDAKNRSKKNDDNYTTETTSSGPPPSDVPSSWRCPARIVVANRQE